MKCHYIIKYSIEHELSELRLILERQTGVLLDTPAETLSVLVSEFMESRHIDRYVRL